ncbi:MAG: SDR family NAD(P)-dependent oxidoreductase [Fibrella sp.]|nr:SDR family NAD(P)-dependent oxidoreductase [Armatimonadota bacterium]
MPIYPYSESTVLITGASRGIGAALARALAKRGVRSLILTARAGGDLETLAAELFASHGTRVETVVADLSDAAAPAAIKAETDRRGLTVDLLINNAGWGTHGTFDATDPAKSRDMIEVNVQALVELSHLYLPQMIARNRGGIVNIASTAAFQPVPFMAVYGATKAFVLSFTEALAVEVTEQGADGVRIVGLCPGGTATSFGDGMLRGHFEKTRQHTPEQVAEETLAALDKNAPVAVVGTANYLMTLSGRFAPRRTVAEVAGSLFRPADLPAKARKSAVPRERVGVFAVTAAMAAVAVATMFMARRGRS